MPTEPEFQQTFLLSEVLITELTSSWFEGLDYSIKNPTSDLVGNGTVPWRMFPADDDSGMISMAARGTNHENSAADF